MGKSQRRIFLLQTCLTEKQALKKFNSGFSVKAANAISFSNSLIGFNQFISINQISYIPSLWMSPSHCLVWDAEMLWTVTDYILASIFSISENVRYHQCFTLFKYVHQGRSAAGRPADTSVLDTGLSSGVRSRGLCRQGCFTLTPPQCFSN